MMALKMRKLNSDGTLVTSPFHPPPPREHAKEALKSPPELAEDVKFLLENDYVVLPVFEDDSDLSQLRRDALDVIMAAPEFEDYSYHRVLGGFGAQATASSFHHPKARLLRVELAKRTREFALDLAQATGHAHVEELMDRLCIRLPGTSISAETPHRDVAPLGSEQMTDLIYGGWLNLDNESQHFTCWPGSAVKYEDAHVGFAAEGQGKKRKRKGKNEEEMRGDADSEEAPAAAPKTRKERQQAQEALWDVQYGPCITIDIPPGHRILFRQTILHKIHKSSVSKEKENGALRLYQGLRVTDDDEPLFGREYLDTTLQLQSAPLLPSGQVPPFYSRTHGMFHKPMVSAMARRMIAGLQKRGEGEEAPEDELDSEGEKERLIGCVHHMSAFKELKKVQGPKAIAKALPEEDVYSLEALDLKYDEWTEREKTWFLPTAS